MSQDEPTKHQRLVALLDHLGLESAHIATQMPIDVAELAVAAPQRIAGLALVVPTRLDPAAFCDLQARVLLVPGATGVTADAVERASRQLPGAMVRPLAGYAAAAWSDVAAERGDELLGVMTGFLEGVATAGAFSSDPSLPRSGSVAGLAYRVSGKGPPLVLLPFFLAASQWDPIEAGLSERFTVIRVGGPHVGGVAALEDRGRQASYRALLATMAETAGAKAGEPILDVGCGSGVFARLLAARLGAAARIDAVDVNGYLVDEGRLLADEEGVGGRIHFRVGSAEQLPFADARFDCVLSVTVLEECDADRAIAEMVRVARPGGRVGIVVRAIDMPQWWSMDLDHALRGRAETPPQSVSPRGVADKSLYARMRRAGLQGIVAFPQLVTLDSPGSTIWRYREDHVLAQLDEGERQRWQQLANEAAASAGLFQAHAVHCAVGVKR